MSEEKALVPIEEKTVDFYGDQIQAALVQLDGKSEVYVPIKPLCDYLGLDWPSQRKRINRDEVLKDVQGMVIMTTPSGKQQVICLPLEFIPGWLFGIEVSRVKPELREKALRYRRECFQVLWQTFKEQALPFVAESLTFEPVSREPNPVLMQIREQALAQAKMSEALARMAEQQMEIEARAIDAQEQAYYAHQRLNEFGHFANRVEVRLGDLERLVKPGATISGPQAASISHEVKALAEFLTTKQGPTDKTGRVHYQAIFAELYRRFGVGDYHLIRQQDYAAVLDFLDDWRVSSGGQPQPRQTSMELPEPE